MESGSFLSSPLTQPLSKSTSWSSGEQRLRPEERMHRRLRPACNPKARQSHSKVVHIFSKPSLPLMTTRPAYPGYFTQTYRIGDHLYSTGGSEAQKPPNRSTVCKQPYQWASEHNDEIKDTLVHRGLVQTDCDAARVAVANANAGTQGAFDLGTKLIGQKLSLTDDLAGQLRGRVGAVDGELAALLASMGDTQAAIDGKNKSLDAVGAYLDLRAGRYASERLCDPVQGDLERMRATLNESVRLLESALSAQQSEQKRLETRKELLLADIADKEAAMAIDAEAKGFSSANRPRTAPSVQAAASMTVPRGMNLMHAPYDPVMWRQNTNTLCSEAQKACHTAARLRAVTTKLIGDRAAAEREVRERGRLSTQTFPPCASSLRRGEGTDRARRSLLESQRLAATTAPAALPSCTHLYAAMPARIATPAAGVPEPRRRPGALDASDPGGPRGYRGPDQLDRGGDGRDGRAARRPAIELRGQAGRLRRRHRPPRVASHPPAEGARARPRAASGAPSRRRREP